MRFRIVPKRDWSGPGFWINGRWIRHGFVVTDGFCNVMPGAAWFTSIPRAMRAIRIYLETGGDAADFWREYYKPDAC